jgi:hypothetical protein
MPSFTSQIPNLVAVGPVVELYVGPSHSLAQALAKKGKSAPSPVQVLAMIDTGSSGTVLAPPVVQRLGIHPVGVAQRMTPSTKTAVPVNQYHVGLSFPNQVAVPDVLAIEAPLGGQPVQCLIGLDSLSQGVLVYIGYTQQFTLSF